MRKRFFLTGATGAVCSHHVPELLERGYEVTCLLRGEKPQERLAEVMPADACHRVNILSGDITSPLGGVSQADIRSLRGKFDCLVHHAGSVKFDKNVADETYAANIGGTANMLSLAQELGIPRFVYNSSVYANGKEPRNPYEYSKAAAEQLVRKWANGRFLILRPSIVVGHSQTGETNSYTGYYGWFAGFSYLKHQWRKLWNQSRSSCQGFHFEDDVLILDEPLWLEHSTTSTLNMVPVDWLASAMTDVIEKGQWGRAYNLADPRPPEVAWVIKESFDILGIRGVRRKAGQVQSPKSPVLSQAQQRIDKRLEIYLPYVTFERQFGCDALGEAPPRVDRAFLETMLQYALGTRFGHQKQVAAAV